MDLWFISFTYFSTKSLSQESFAQELLVICQSIAWPLLLLGYSVKGLATLATDGEQHGHILRVCAPVLCRAEHLLCGQEHAPAARLIEPPSQYNDPAKTTIAGRMLAKSLAGCVPPPLY